MEETNTERPRLTSEELAIMLHTRRSGRYCGDSPAMQNLVLLGMMKSLGKAAWCPDEFFALSQSGSKFLRECDQ